MDGLTTHILQELAFEGDLGKSLGRQFDPPCQPH
jgi:hypothetical protein